MEHEISHRPSYAQLPLELGPDESVRSEAGGMVSKSPSVEVETSVEGGIVKSISRSLFGGESFFMNTFSTPDGGEIQLAPALSGDVQHHELGDETLYVQSSSFLASDPTVEVDTEFGGPKTFFGGEGLVCEFSGEGTVWTQTRSPDGFLSWLIPKIPQRNTTTTTT
jgi:uncharacterized protein (TIGR00266 family)